MPKKTRKMNSPIVWFGGKGVLASKLLQFIPDHQAYCEVFGGAGSLLFAKEPVGLEIYNDIDDRLYNFFSVLRDPGLFEEFARLVTLTPYHRKMFYRCRELAEEEDVDPVTAAWAFFCVSSQSFSGSLGSGWSYSLSKISRNMSSCTSKWFSKITKLQQFHSRVMQLQVECDSFEKLLSRYDAPGTFFYLDPPYVLSTRSSGGYRHELDDEDHKRLVSLCAQSQGKIMLSGYKNDIYLELEERGWERVDFDVAMTAANSKHPTGGVGKRPRRTESIWINYKIH